MKTSIASFIVGFIFAVGLALSGMTQPQKVVGFLDIFGTWDPSLIFVMMGAIAIHALAFYFIRKRSRPLFDIQWHIPTKKDLTPSLLIGSFIFGIGWGLGGYCPGPALASLPTLDSSAWVFVASMIAGMGLYRWVDSKIHFKR